MWRLVIKLNFGLYGLRDTVLMRKELQTKYYLEVWLKKLQGATFTFQVTKVTILCSFDVLFVSLKMDLSSWRTLEVPALNIRAERSETGKSPTSYYTWVG